MIFKKHSQRKQNNPLRIFYRIGIIILTTLILMVAGLYGAMFILARGPSETAKRLFVLSVKETSAGGFLADIYLSDKEIDEIMSVKANAAAAELESGEKTNTSLINVPKSDDTDSADTNSPPGSSDTESATDTESGDKETIPDTSVPDDGHGIEIIEIKGTTYKGTMLAVSDPRRVTVGMPDKYGEDCAGLSLRNMLKKYGAVAGINAGGFYDPNGKGKGGMPTGIVIYDGKIIWGAESKSVSLIGFDTDGILHVGTMTGAEALEAGVVQAVSFGPALVINGKPCNSRYDLGGGFNPRTAIGQCADGTVLLLVVEGRSISSLGATYDDLVEIMLKHGAVNASNLDGGASSLMLYEGRSLTDSAYVYGERVIASSFLVK